MPPSRLDFPKSAHKMDPPPLGKFHFCHTPWKYYHSLCKPKISNFCSARYRIFYPYFFFWETFGGYCDQHITRRYVTYLKDAYRRICDMKIIDFIPWIPLHNFDKTAVAKKVHFQDRWERTENETLYNNQNNILFSACFAWNFGGSNRCEYISERFNFIWKLESQNFSGLEQKSYCFLMT